MSIAFSGCLLPSLIVFNLLFGRLFFGTGLWLAIEGVLLLLFIINSYIGLWRIHSSVRAKRKDVIDVEGKVVK
ncbi:MAG: hypothetical protein V1869_05945 [Candidatus Omnitrophota bacterium]